MFLKGLLMRTAERVLVIGGVMLAIGLGLSARVPGGDSAAWAGQPGAPSPTAAAPRIATLDVYSIVEKLMARPEMQAPGNELAARLNERIGADQQALEALQRELQGMQASDPRAGAGQQEFLAKRDAFNRLVQDSTAELDRFRSGQLIECYRQTREAAGAVADRTGYTHVLSSRAADAEMQPQGMALGLQELLARPVLKGVPADDITGLVAAELKLE